MTHELKRPPDFAIGLEHNSQSRNKIDLIMNSAKFSTDVLQKQILAGEW